MDENGYFYACNVYGNQKASSRLLAGSYVLQANWKFKKLEYELRVQISTNFHQTSTTKDSYFLAKTNQSLDKHFGDHLHDLIDKSRSFHTTEDICFSEKVEVQKHAFL